MTELYLIDRSINYLDISNLDFKYGYEGWTGVYDVYGSGWYWYDQKIYPTFDLDSQFFRGITGLENGETYVIEIDLSLNAGELDFSFTNNTHTIDYGGTQSFELVADTSNSIIVLAGNSFRGYINWIRIYKKGDQTTTYHEIEISSEPSITLTRTDLLNISTRSSSYSETSTLKGTSKNNKVLSSLFNIDVYETNRNLNLKTECVYLQDGFVILNGTFELTQVEYIEQTSDIIYSYTLVSGLKSLGDLLSDYTLKGNDIKTDDITFKEYNHSLTLDNITNSWNSGSTGYFYPIIDYSIMQYSYVYANKLRPALYWKEVVDKIFEKIGKTYTSTFLNSDTFKNLIYPFSNDRLNADEDLTKNKIYASTSADYTTTTLTSDYNSVVPIRLTDDSTGPCYDLNNNFNTTDYSFVVPYTGEYTIKNRATFRTSFTFLNLAAGAYYFSNSSRITTKMVLTVNGVIVAEESIIRDFPAAYAHTTGGDYVYSDQPLVESTVLGLQEGDVVKMGLIVSSNVSARNDDDEFVYAVNGSSALNNGVDFRIYTKLLYDDIVAPGSIRGNTIEIIPTQSDDVYYGQSIEMDSILHEDLKRIDVIEYLSNMFNLVIDEDKDDPNNFIIETYDTYYAGGENKDWTKKMDRSQGLLINRVPTLINKNFKMTYENDDDDLNNKYTEMFSDRIFGDKIIRNEIETKEDYLIKIGFAPTPSILIQDTPFIVPRILLTKDDELVKQTFTPRILQKVKVEFDVFNETDIVSDGENIFYTIYGELGSTTQQGTFQNYMTHIYTASNFDNPYSATTDINFGACGRYFHNYVPVYDDLYNVYWRNRINNIMSVDSRIITATFDLSAEDIYKLKFNDTIIIDGNFFIIDSINDWKSGQLTKVSLIKILEQNLLTEQEKIDSVFDDAIDGVAKWLEPIRVGGSVPYNPPIGPVGRNDNVILLPRFYDVLPYNTGTTSGTTSFDNSIISRDASGIFAGINNNVSSRDALVFGSENDVINSDKVSVSGDENYLSNATNVNVLGSNNNAVNVENTSILGNNITASQSNAVYIGGNNIYVSQNPQTIVHIIDGGKDIVINAFNRMKQTHIIDGMKDTTRTLLKSYDSTFIVSSQDTPFYKTK